MNKKRLMELDFMNRNTIIGMAMANAFWEIEKKDLISLISPFVLYAIGQTTREGAAVDIEKVCSVMNVEFGYKKFQPAIVKRILHRETSNKNSKDLKAFEKKYDQYYLIHSLSAQNEVFQKKKTECKSHSDQVVSALTNYLNEKHACRRTDYDHEEVETALLTFIESKGNSVLSSADDFRQLRSKDNELAYHLGRFVLQEKERQSVVMDYLMELTKGYFVTTAIFLQAENTDITKSLFKDVTFYLDTRVLLAYLGYKSQRENESIQTMVKSLRKHGAKLAYFVYNAEEVRSILKAYRNAVLLDDYHTTVTLEYFDEHGRSSAHVEMAQKYFENNLKADGIMQVRMDEVLESVGAANKATGLLDDSKLSDLLFEINPNYNTISLSDDIKAINTVSRIRGGKELPYIERSQAVFVTSNATLVAATKQYLDRLKIDPGFPLTITVEDLCVIAWIKDFEQGSNLPKMRLLESVSAAVTPSRELMDNYFDWIERLEHEKAISDDDAALLRVELFARQELMQLTCGNKEKLNGATIQKIRDKLGETSFNNGHAQGVADAHREQAELERTRRNEICKKAEDEVRSNFKKIEAIGIVIIQVLIGMLTAAIVIASVKAFLAEKTVWGGILAIASIASAIETFFAIVRKKGVVIRAFSRHLERKRTRRTDKKKDKYLSLLDSQS